ncbi:DUF1972 domain-containing protein [Fulvivirga sediminis]|uniref:DUF1972 domain-containing protein n=1 Tax=Fulvivirga sediminis TaxID=2803949 RepID=A0A937FA26_9BACT|nr:DUF1972 domain-containing protein [Fulvivirga sediminis]MBL3656788.1 DUF1972 domain-containing protein [Fulvivirga sediminis]
MKTKKLAIIGTVGLPANYGGFETLVSYLTQFLNKKYDLTVYCSAKKYAKEERLKEYNGARLVFLPFDANGAQSIIYDIISIIHAIFYADVLLVLGVPGAVVLPFVKWFTNKKIIVSIDGVEWKRDKWGKYVKKYLRYCERLAVKYSHVDISDNEAIQDYTASEYKTLSNVIEYGGDHTLKREITKAHIEQYSFLDSPYAFKVCRIEPENNIQMVLESFANQSDMALVLVGNWKNSEYGISCRERYQQYKNLHLLDPIYDQESLDVLRGNCKVYIHGHSAGGTNPSLVEAMYLERAIFCFDVSYNRATTENKAKYFKNTYELQELLISTSNEELQQLSITMKNIAKRRYTWEVIANKYGYLVDILAFKKTKGKVSPQLSSSIHTSDLLQYEMAHYSSLESIHKP